MSVECSHFPLSLCLAGEAAGLVLSERKKVVSECLVCARLPLELSTHFKRVSFNANKKSNSSD